MTQKPRHASITTEERGVKLIVTFTFQAVSDLQAVSSKNPFVEI